MPTVLDWNPAVDPSTLIRTIRETTTAGSVVVMPGDCGYVVLVNPAVATSRARLGDFCEPPAVLAWGPDDPAGLGLRVPAPVRRLFARAWPAPLVVVVPGRAQWPAHWSAALSEKLAGGPARFRCPEHTLFAAVTPALEMPLLVVDTFLPTAEAALDRLEDPEASAISSGTLAVKGRPTVVAATANGYEIVEQGLMPAGEIDQLAARIVLFVCTGNTCRSPLAEALAKRILAERLGCTAAELPRRGIWVMSAGVSAFGGSPATPEAVAVASEFGPDLGEHRSRAVDEKLLGAADEVIAMTQGHARALASRFPGAGPAPKLLCGEEDLDDPIGSGLDVYRRCAATIQTHLERLIPEWTGL
jgi:protein-tyrosine-phosphatase/tRNA A37 threonylcarbamoyladenosine synthetase subunit TsaC/SUA5/YrdC